MKPLAAVAALTALGAILLATVGRGEQRPNEVADFMRLKLEHSKDVLEGLATEDFGMIARGAQEMSLLAQASTWQVLQTPEYNQQSMEFRRTADAITRAAQDENLDGAALAYVELTMKCVTCHKYVRGVRMASATHVAPALAAR
jgi:cytochrome c556